MKVKDAAMQAFPFIEPADDPAIKAYHPGISLRDYFAAKAMQGIFPLCQTNESAAEECYKVADAMLKAREVNND